MEVWSASSAAPAGLARTGRCGHAVRPQDLCARRRLALLAALLLRHRLADVRHNTTVGQGHVLQKRANVVVVAHSQHHGARVQAAPLLAALRGRLHGQLQQLRSQVLQHGRQVHSARGADAASVLAATHHRADAAHREDQASLRGLGAALAGGLLGAARSSHVSGEERRVRLRGGDGEQ
ncbi:histone H2A, putative [Leishmania tarentolae]|uniref:Histone H2A, putative n=1 Tax=Leishmania tarentolae TaxID=5689 RepID=A0A640KH04_LEITA|nr:histone H2A, putative [Leishmania tarentolae]